MRSGLWTAMVLSVCFAAYATDQVALTNPGFEMGDKTGWEAEGCGWKISPNPADISKGNYGVVNVIAPGDESEWRVIAQAIPGKGGLRYVGGVWVRAMAIGDAQCWFEVQFLDADWNVLRQYQTEHVTADQDFTYVNLPSAGSPPETEMISIRGVVHMVTEPGEKVGVIAFDEFQFDRMP